MNGHPQFEEDFELYALGALDADEKLSLETHLKDCADCTRRLAQARGRVALLSAAAPSVEPPAAVKQRLMARIHADNAAEKSAVPQSAKAVPQSVKAEPRKTGTGFWHHPAPGWGLAFVAAIIAVLFAANNYRLNQQMEQLRAEASSDHATIAQAHAVLELLTAPDTHGVTLTAAEVKPQPEGRVFYRPNHGMIFYAANLPAAPEGRTYQLWMVPTQGNPISAGVFAPNAKGNASIVLLELPAGVTAKAFAVTIEPSGGVPQPTGPKVLIGLVS
jgi:anti-sigma-K factor RskA